MKLAGRDATAFLARPDPATVAVLLYGADASRVAQRRAELVEAMIGPDGAAEMRLARLSGADLRRDPAALSDAARASGFFPGDRAVLVEEASESQTEPFASVLAEWRAGDARIIVTGGALGKAAKLRKTFEAARNAVAIGIYSDPPGRAEIAALLERAGLTRVSRAAMGDIEALARAFEPGEFAQFVTVLALHAGDGPGELGAADVAACAPAAPEAEFDHIVELAAAGEAGRLVQAMRRLGARGGSPTGLTIAAARHFRALHAAALAGGGGEATLGRLRPPVFGPRRTRMAAAARSLGPERIEAALGWIMDADLRLRSGRPTPGPALVERVLVRIAAMKRT